MRSIKLLSVSFLVASFVNAQDATSLYNEGVKLKAEKRSAEAIDKFKKAAQLRPGYIDAMYEMGWCQNDTKDYSGAMETLRKVRAVWPEVTKVFFELGYAFEKSGLTDSAVSSYNVAIKLKPDYGLAYKQLGYIAYEKNDPENALMHFSKYEAAENAKGTTIDSYLYWYRKGYCQNALRQYEGAKSSLFRSLDYKKDYFNTYLEIGFACNKLKQDADAISYYKKAIEIDPKSHVGYNGIGEVYRDTKKDCKEAINWYNKALEVTANERKANFGIGYCLNSLNRHNEAIPYLRKAIQSESTYTAAYVEIGYSYYKISDNALAETNLKKALELNEKNENARYYLGLIYIDKNNKPKAQQMVDELKALGSKNAASLQEKVNKM